MLIAVAAFVVLSRRTSGTPAEMATPGAVPTASETTATSRPQSQYGAICVTPSPNPQTYNGPPPMKIDPSKHYRATMNTNYGSISIDLYAGDASATVNNFVALSCNGFYSGTKFHRLTTSPALAVLQGGDAVSGNGTGGPGYTIPDELERARRDGYRRGTLAMANTGARNSGGSQFFIVVKDATLPPNYTVFGQVVEGMEVVDEMHAVGTKSRTGDGPPATELKINSISISEVQ